MTSVGPWDEHARGIIDTCERLQREIAALEISTASGIREARHAANNAAQLIATHIEICKRRERASDLHDTNMQAAIQDISRHRDADLADAKKTRADDLSAINAALATINTSVSEKTNTTTKLLWAALVAWAGTATGGMIWALGKLLNLL